MHEGDIKDVHVGVEIKKGGEADSVVIAKEGIEGGQNTINSKPYVCIMNRFGGAL